MAENIPQDKEKKPGRLVRTETKFSERSYGSGPKGGDVFKLAIAVALVVAGLWAFYNVQNLSIYVRVLFPVVGVIVGLLIIFYWCDFGRRLVVYVRDSVVEFKKVVWPSRQDAVRMTFFVVVFVAVLSLFIYAVDSLISWLFFDLLLKRG
ncbi:MULTISPECIES: preprotein translocase subunit SecE [unclassified Neisseria]|uniref:preprotein translocase subunit SecE n=1 Tax=unclassified Neisseria TaxID=2623750 RepID=UPI001071E4E7|nr:MULTISPECIES: preprotein translocase subunit SecE [unclassified Neisseria]MBF0803757.1 preprotein translocase subunit SecE [Neisseria sp. 19428wB4_WF04]TFU43505.1 preprotein translocase subunit SecE [Neisseria sp. WF04]